MPESIHFQRDGDCFWITLRGGRVDYEASPEWAALRKELESSGVVRLIVDLSQLPYFGSTVLELLVLLWRRVGRHEGRLVVYKPSAIGREVLSAARLDQLWPVADTRDEAQRLVSLADIEA